jgi:histidyl-tRNA synthetase
MENLSSLLGKYGEEGDKLLFKVLNSGDFLSGTESQDFQERNLNKLSMQLCEKGLRYDLTVPFARYVVQNHGNIVFPFKRFQIQPVWRADRPQKGRYREFYQCDADVVGSDSLLNEAELVQIVEQVFSALGVAVTLKINNRKILSGMAELIGEASKVTDLTVAIDKLDKIGIEKVKEELMERGFTRDAILRLEPVLALSGTDYEKLSKLEVLFAGNETGLKGVAEVRTLLGYLEALEIKLSYVLDLTLARGLNYYTGAIFEVKAHDVEIGSISGGGRYDNLTGVFGQPGLSGVGISFGADRIYDVLTQLQGFPEDRLQGSRILFVNFGEKEALCAMKMIRRVREAGISAEMYPDPAKLKKQMGYADSRKIPYVAVIGEEEMEKQLITLKDMTTGTQSMVSPEELIQTLTL